MQDNAWFKPHCDMNTALRMQRGSQAEWPRCFCRADELAGELAATKAELDQEVGDLRDVLNATLEDKAALASQCSALEAQVGLALQGK